MQIPIARFSIEQKEKDLVNEALDKTEISGNGGSFIPKFEKDFSAYCGVSHGVAVMNGTVALHLALAALRIGSGDEVLVSSFTNMATFFAVLYQGATPIPIDIEPDTWNLDPALLEDKITPRTKAIMVVHIYGHPVDMDPVMAIAKKHNLPVVEDAAEAHGAEYKGKRTGSFGIIGCFSFYAGKVITSGEGGMVVTNDKKLADRARMLKSLAFGTGNKFLHQDIGFNYRMTNLQAALGLGQLERIESLIAQKRAVVSFYNQALKDIPELQLPVEKPYARNVYWVYNVVLRGALKGKRDKVMAWLKEKGVETRESFVPYNMQKDVLTKGLVKPEDCPVANDIAENGFYIPSGPVITAAEMQHVADSLKEVLAVARKG